MTTWEQAVSATNRVSDTIRAALMTAQGDPVMMTCLLAGQAGEWGREMILDAADTELKALNWWEMDWQPPGTFRVSDVPQQYWYRIGVADNAEIRITVEFCGETPVMDLQMIDERTYREHYARIDLNPELWRQILAVI